MDKLKILFFCGDRSPWGYSHLEPLLNEPRFQVVAVVLATEYRWNVFRRALSGEQQLGWKFRAKRLVGKLLGRSSTQRVLKVLRQRNIPVIWCDDVNTSEAINSFRAFCPDLLFSAAYPQIFKKQLLTVMPFGSFNSHPSLLPRCRGAHPVFWTIASGESRSGSTIHVMTSSLDKGDIVAQVEVEVLPSETRSHLYAKLIATIPQLLTEFADFLTTPGAKGRPQNEAEATYFRNDRKIHRRVFWSEMDATQIHNLVRACDGSAYFWHGDRCVFLQRVEPLATNRNMTNNITVPPGTVVDIDAGKPIVAARGGFVRLMEMRVPLLKRVKFSIGMVLS